MKLWIIVCVLFSGVCSGCATYSRVNERHPHIVRFVEASLVLSAAGAWYDHKHQEPQAKEFEVSEPLHCAECQP